MDELEKCSTSRSQINLGHDKSRVNNIIIKRTVFIIQYQLEEEEKGAIFMPVGVLSHVRSSLVRLYFLHASHSLSLSLSLGSLLYTIFLFLRCMGKENKLAGRTLAPPPPPPRKTLNRKIIPWRGYGKMVFRKIALRNIGKCILLKIKRFNLRLRERGGGDLMRKIGATICALTYFLKQGGGFFFLYIY